MQSTTFCNTRVVIKGPSITYSKFLLIKINSIMKNLFPLEYSYFKNLLFYLFYLW